MAEEGKTNVSTQQQGTGEAKTDAGNAADQKGADQSGGQQQSGADDKGADKSAGADTKGADGKQSDAKADAGSKDQGDGKGAQSKAPEKYDLKLSDGSMLDSSAVDEIAAIARERGLSQEDASGFLRTVENETMKRRNANVTQWNETLKADKDFGGANYDASLKSVQRYAGFLRANYPDALDLLERTGYTSHPAIAKLLRDMGNRMAEDKHERGGGQGKREKPPLEERLYGATTPKAESKVA